MTRPLVIGVASAAPRGDDAVGHAVARAVEASGADVDVRCLPGDPARLLDAWAGRDLVVVVDCAVAGPPHGPGHCLVLDGTTADLGALARSPTSSHGFGLAAAIELGRALDALPPRLTVVAVVGSEFEVGTDLSPAVVAAVPAAALCVRQILGDE